MQASATLGIIESRLRANITTQSTSAHNISHDEGV